MASNIFNSIRKSYTVQVLLTSVMTNLLVLGEPAMAMMTDYYNYKEVKRHASQHHLPQFFTPDILDNASENVLEKNQEVPVLEDALKHRLERSSFTEASVFYAPEKLGVIGKRSIYEGENPQDNFFTIVLPDVDFSDYEGILQYELYGVSDASQTTKSINNFSAYGGEIIAINDEWIQIEEVVSSTQLKKGVNEIFFNRRSNENYLYKIKNLGIKLTQKNHNEFDLPKDKLIVYNGDLYFSGIVNDEKVEKLSILNQDVYVSNGVYEAVITNIPESLNEVEIRLQYSDNRQEVVCKQLINHNVNKADFNFSSILSTKSVENYTQEALVQGCVNHNALSITIDDVKQLTKEHILATEGLHFKDTRILNEDLENVTAGDYFGYRINKMPVVEDALVELRLKYDSDKIPAGYTPKDVKIFSYDKLHKSWKALAVDAIDYDNEEIVSRISAISANETDFINGVIKVPESPETASFAPTTITDMKYADPSAGVVSIAPPSPNSTGAAATSFPLKLPQGRNGMQPNLEVTYNSEAGNGWMGIGWNLSTPAISINTKWGVPLFTTSHETEIYSLNGADLVLKLNNDQYSNPHRTNLIPRTTSESEREFYLRKEGSYQIIIRHGSNPQNYYWEVIDKQGNQTFYGGLPGVGVDNNSVIKTSEGHIAHWGIKRTIDTYGNYVEYSYFSNSPDIFSNGEAAVSAREFYINKIEYTKHTNNAISNYYQIDFIRNSYSGGGNISREDVIINAKNGFVHQIKDLLTEIKISLKNNNHTEEIRTYRFNYETSSFKKKLLNVISEYDSNGNLFYSNSLDYYTGPSNSNLFGGSVNWSSSHDQLTSDLPGLPGVILDIIPLGSPLGTSSSLGYSFGLRAGGGIGFNPSDIGFTIGGSFSYSKDFTTAKITLIDINGDGLPDKVYESGNGIYYRPNNGLSFGDPIKINGVGRLSYSKTKTNGYGVDASFTIVGIGKSWSRTSVVTDNYFTDFNGDGLPDYIFNNRVKFNTAGSNNTNQRNFIDHVSSTENTIDASVLPQEMLNQFHFPSLEELKGEHPQFDHVKVWSAPFDGQVSISGFAKILQKNSNNAANNFRVTIEKGGGIQTTGNTELLSLNNIQTKDYSYPITKNNVTVLRGDKLFFRIHNLDKGSGGKIEWNPIIKYCSITSNDLPPLGTSNCSSSIVVDENNEYLYQYDALQDYMFNNGSGFQIHGEHNAIKLNYNLNNTTFTALQFSDNIVFNFKLSTYNKTNGTLSNQTVYKSNLNHITGNFDNTNTITVSSLNHQDYRYVLDCYVTSTSNVKWSAIDWKPTVTDNSNTFTYPISVRYHTYDDNMNQKKYWIDSTELVEPVIDQNIPTDGNSKFMVIDHDFFAQNYGGFLMNFNDSDTPVKINWVVKEELGGVVKTIRRKTFYLHVTDPDTFPYPSYEFLDVNGTVLNFSNGQNKDYYEFNLSKQYIKNIVDSGGKLYSALYVNNKKMKNANVSISLNLHPDQIPTYPDPPLYTFTPVISNKPFIAHNEDFYGFSYRGWGQFLYNGGYHYKYNEEGIPISGSLQNYAGNISMKALSMESEQNSTNINEDSNPDDLDEFENKPIRVVLYGQEQYNKHRNSSIVDAIYELENPSLLTATVGRFGEGNLYDVFIDITTLTSGSGGAFLGLKQYSRSTGSAITGSITIPTEIIDPGFSFSGTHSTASSKTTNQYVDLNGDRYPDIVTEGKIQYTNMKGALSLIKTNNNNFVSREESEDMTIGASVSTNYPNSTESKGSSGETSSTNSATTSNKTSTNISSGVNPSSGESYNQHQWIDINGDGLPDKVKINKDGIFVSLNLGYSFSEEFNWFSVAPTYLKTSRRTNINASGSLGTELEFPDASGGTASHLHTSSYAFGFGAAMSVASADTQLVDINGDGLVDLVYRLPNSSGMQYKYLLNTGDKFDTTQEYSLINKPIEMNRSTAGNVFGTATVGFIVPLFGVPIKFVATGSLGLNAALNQTTATLQDIDGDGYIDVLNKGSSSNNSNIAAHLNKIGKTHLLKKVTTPLSGSWTIDYERNGNTYDLPQSKWVLSSIETFDNFTADNAYRPDTTLKTVAYENPKYDRRERDFFGYGKVKISDIKDNVVYRTLETAYHNENYYLSGAEKSTALYAGTNDQLLSEQHTFYNILNPESPQVAFYPNMGTFYIQDNYTLLDQSRFFVVPVKVETTSYEGSQSLVSEKRFLEYNSFGNLKVYLDKGEGGNDAFVTHIDYYLQSEVGVANGTGFPRSITVYKENDQNNFLRNRQAEYNNFGKLRRVTTVLNSNEDNRVDFEYDNYGNLNKIDYLNNLNASETEHYTLSINYDNTLHTYPIETINSFGETSYAEYDYWFGIPVLTTDKNAQKMRTRIDNRGRIVEITGPNEYAEETGANKKWTIRMEYKGEAVIHQNHSLYPEEYVFQAQGSFAAGTASNNNAQHYAVTRHFDPEISGNQLLTISIVDGFGQAVQLKKTHYAYNESSLQNVLGWLTNSFDKTDALGRSTGTYLPSFLSSYPSNINALGTHRNYTEIPLATTAFTATTYDHRDRPLTVQQIGENDQAVMTYGIESGMFMQQVVNEKGQTYTSYTDKRGRNRKTVQEDINTYFAYNAINELVSVTNQNGFVTNYKYDLAGRKIEVQHPDRGVTRFVYDRAGNITEQTNSNLLLTGNGQQTIKYKYDFGRLIAVTYPQTPENNVNYTYGDPSDIFAKDERAIGRLLYQEDASGVQVFGYGRMGELTKNLRSVAVADYQSYWFLTQWEYDSWNRVQKIIYPDKEVVDYQYNEAGMLYSISGQLPSHSPTSIVERIDYNAYGERRSIKYGNGTYTTYNYDNRRRMDALKHSFNSGSQWYDLEKKYDYDPLSNITQITTLEPETVLNNTAGHGELGGVVYHHYKYDQYNRLIEADGHYVGTNDLPGIPYLKQDYVLNMEYNNDHTIKAKTQTHQQGTVEAYGAPMANSIPMAKTSYKLDYSAYNTGAYVIGNDDFGYSQPHAPRQIVEYPFDGADLDDPRTRIKNIKYDANGNQTEITETLGEVTTSLRKNLWDEENRLRAVDLKPSETNKPIAIYTYDAGGERIVRYNYDKMDAHSNALPLNRSSRDNVMLYPNGLLMAKALKVNPMEKDLPLSYTKHYYIGSERVSAKTGTMDWLGYYPSSWLYEEMPALNIDVQTESSQKFSNAATQVASIHQLFGSSLFALNTTDNFTIIHDDTHDPKKMDVFYFHPDHLGSSSYITNMRGMVSQHMEYLPFGELLVDEHKNSYNSPFKYNGKEFDEETGNYYYGARYYDPKWSIFISIDPLAEKYPSISSYAYVANNPIIHIDPDGRDIIPVHGTWSNPKKAWKDLLGISKASYNLFKDNRLGASFQWSGGNYAESRTKAALGLIDHIRTQMQNETFNGEITLVGHSHGGNVSIEALNMMAEMQEFDNVQLNLLTINTPVREDYQLSEKATGRVNHVNVYDPKDPVQSRGGKSFVILPDLPRTPDFMDINTKGTGEYGPASRTFKNIENIPVDNPQGIFGDFHNSQNRVNDWIDKTK